jgi:alkanesulfonate monooxygenase SsuD/methylene tetrahydromethanopterin reductase-like flavin-dependent oxidoreductase (luciferase family)
MAYASVSQRIRLGTGVLPIFSRTPVATAQAAATIDEFSRGRMVLGLGVSHKVTVENWFDSEIPKPVTQMREYVGIVRAVLRGETPPEGEFFNTKFAFMGYEPRQDLPIQVAALSPNMLRLAGEVGDGSAAPTTSATSSSPTSARAARRPASRWRASRSSARSRPRSPTTAEPPTSGCGAT